MFLLLSALVVAFIVVDDRTTGGFFVALPGLVLLLLLLGGGLLLKGGTAQQLEITDDPPPAELVRTMHAHERPFFVCTRCRRIAEGGMCDRCGTQADCLEIQTEDDLRMAISATS